MRELDSLDSEQKAELLRKNIRLTAEDEKLNDLAESAVRVEPTAVLERISTEFSDDTTKDTEEESRTEPYQTEKVRKAGAFVGSVPKPEAESSAVQDVKEEKEAEILAEDESEDAPEMSAEAQNDSEQTEEEDSAQDVQEVTEPEFDAESEEDTEPKLPPEEEQPSVTMPSEQNTEDTEPESQAEQRQEAEQEAEASETETEAETESEKKQPEDGLSASGVLETPIPDFDPEPLQKPKPRVPQEDSKRRKTSAVRQEKAQNALNEAGHAIGVLETPTPDFEPEPPKKKKPKPAKAQKPKKVKTKAEKPEKTPDKPPSKLKTFFSDLETYSNEPGILETPEPDFEAEPEFFKVTPVTGQTVRVPKYQTLWWEDLAERWRRFLHKVPKVLWAFIVAYLIQPEVGRKAEYSDDLQGIRGLPPEKAMEKARKEVAYYRWRTAAVLLLALLAGYITTASSIGLPLPAFISYIHYPFAYLFLLSAIQIGAMLLSVSYLADGLRAIPKGKWKAETLVAFACFVNLLYTFQIMVAPRTAGYLPYHMTAVLMLFFGMMTRTQRYGNALRTCKAATHILESYVAVNGIRDEEGVIDTVYKQTDVGRAGRMLNRVWEEDPAERLMRRYVPLVLLLTLIFAVTASVKGAENASFLWCWSALLSAALPGGIMMAFAFPFATLTKKFTPYDVIMGGYRSAKALRDVDRVILQENDFFSQGIAGKTNVKIANLKVYSDYTPAKVNLYTLAVLERSECGLYDAMQAFLSDMTVRLPSVENFEFYENGGIGAFIDGNRVLAGSYQFISRSSVTIPEEVKRGTGIYVAINMQFAGWYPIHYTTQGSMIQAFGRLQLHKIRPVAAIRDFNLNRKMLESRFKMKENSLEYPELPERLALSELRSSRKDELLVVMAKNRAEPYMDAIQYGKQLYRTTRFNMMFGLLTAIAGVVLTFLLLFARAASAITPGNLFGYGVVCFLPTLISSLGAKRH